jgi:hypothetical protein
MHRLIIAVLAVLAVVGCAGPEAAVPSTTAPSTGPSTTGPSTTAPSTTGQRFPDVIAVSTTPGPEGVTFNVTISSPYDTPQRYADAFRVRSPRGEVYGVRELAHDHATEQPFTRDLSDVALPEVVTEVVIEARDSRNGWGGRTQTVSFAPAG